MFGDYKMHPDSGVNPPYAPAYPVEWECPLRTLEVVTRVDAGKIDALLKDTPFERVNDRVAFRFMLSPGHTLALHSGQMFDLMVTVAVRYQSLFTQTHIFMYCSDPMGICAGRELFGYTKKDTHYAFDETDDGQIRGWVRRRGVPLVDFHFTPAASAPLVRLTDEPEQPAGEIHVRRLPDPEKPATAYADVVYRRTPLRYSPPLPGHIDWTLHASAFDPIAALAPEVLGAHFMTSDVYGGGIGCAIARRLARQGWRLVLADRTAQALADCRQQCEALGAALRYVEADVRHEPDVAALIAVAQAGFGGCQGFVSNAGIAGVVEATVDYPSEVFRQVLEVNTVGTFLCLKHALPLLRRTGGSFVAIASTSAIRGRANMSAYVASKHAVLGLVRSSALECLGSAVRVNAVLPGPTQTAMIDDIDRMAAQRSPQGQISRPVAAPYGKPEDVAHTVAFLLSSEARHINGAALVTDAGSTVA